MQTLNMAARWLPLWIIVAGMALGAATQQITWAGLATLITLPIIFFQTVPKKADDDRE